MTYFTQDNVALKSKRENDLGMYKGVISSEIKQRVLGEEESSKTFYSPDLARKFTNTNLKSIKKSEVGRKKTSSKR